MSGPIRGQVASQNLCGRKLGMLLSTAPRHPNLETGLGLARAALKTIKQNLFWAFFYNALGIPLAVLGFFSPVFSALAMGLSDLVVIGNALRLRYWRLR